MPKTIIYTKPIIRIYMGENIRNINATFQFPENRLSVKQQIEWVKSTLVETDNDISVKTHSHIILNAIEVYCRKKALEFYTVDDDGIATQVEEVEELYAPIARVLQDLENDRYREL